MTTISTPAETLENMTDMQFAGMMVNALAREARRHYDQFFGTDRDLTAVLGRKITGNITPEMITERMMRDSTANSVVTRPVDATWKRPPPLWDGDRQDTDFTQAWDSLVKKQRVWAMLKMVDRLATMHRYAILVLGVKDGKKLAEPLESDGNGLELAYIQPYGEEAVMRVTYDTDHESDRLGQPKMYTIEVKRRVSDVEDVTERVMVHHSRVIHIVQNPLNEKWHGLPFLLPIWDDLDDMLKVVGGSSENFWRMAAEDVLVRLSSDFQFPSEAAREEFKEGIYDRANRLTNLLMVQGADDVNIRSGQAVDPSGVFSVLARRIAGYSGVPQRVLFGAEAGTLASEQDESNFAGNIATRQLTYAQPEILEPFIDFCIAHAILPAPQSGIYHLGEQDRNGEWRWPSIETMSDKEEAEIAANRALAMQRAADTAVVTGDILDDDEVRAFGALPPQVASNG